MALTDEQKTARSTRRMEILTRVTGSGEAAAEAATKLAVDIETFEWANGDAEEAARRRAVVAPMLSSGAVRMAEIIAKAKASLSAMVDFAE